MFRIAATRSSDFRCFVVVLASTVVQFTLVCAKEPAKHAASPIIFYEMPALTDTEIESLRRGPTNEIYFGYFPDAVVLQQETLNKVHGITGVTSLGFYVSDGKALKWKSLSRIPTLKNLEISGDVHFSHDDLKSLSLLPQLEHLFLGGDFQVDAIQSIQQLSILKSLKLHANGKLPLCDSVASAKLDKMTSLSLHEEVIEGKELQLLAYAYARQVTRLDLSNLKADAIEHLANFVNLKALSLKLRGDKGSGLDFVEKLRELETLSIQGATFYPRQLQSLAHHPSLKNLYLSGVVPEESTAALLSTMPCLESVQFAGDALPRNVKILIRKLEGEG